MENSRYKFRAWDKREGKIIPVWNIEFMPDGGDGEDVNNHRDITRCILMQYTGLKDGDGKEVYEGDIVEFEGNYTTAEKCGKKIGVVEWDYAGFIIRVGEHDYNFDETNEFYAYSKVLGNIYENPELLK